MTDPASDMAGTVRRAFGETFGGEPAVIVRAPGRVNLIGEHTDYNDGFVLPMAIDRAVWIALRPVEGGAVRVRGLDMEGALGEFGLETVRSGREAARMADGNGSVAADTPAADDGWLEYLKGTAWALLDAGHELTGWEGVMAGDVPIGAGLSSSAALELATARAFAEAGGWAWDPSAMAVVGQRAENAWVGVNCGIMDQMISACGRAEHAYLLDCRSLSGRHVPLPAGTAVVILDTGTRRGLVDSAYNERRSQCEAVAAHFGVRALRDITPSQLQRRAPELDDTALRRARHVVTENQRTEAAAVALQTGDAETTGALMDASHASLRDDFEVSSVALDSMVAIARQQPGCHGARMTGAGFGGCAVALVAGDAAGSMATDTARAYAEATGNTPQIYVCTATDGAGPI